MKKIHLTAVLLLLSLILPFAVHAAPSTSPDTPPESTLAETIRLLPPEELRAGETVTFTLWLYGDNVRAIQGSISFDSTLFTLVECETIAKGWSLHFSSEESAIQYLGLDTMGEGISGKAELCTFTFRITTDLPADATAIFTPSPAVIYNGEQELTYPGEAITCTILPPLSTDCALDSLEITNGILIPTFSPDVTAYTVTLPYATEQAEIIALPRDITNADVKISSTDLTVGENKIEITVIAQSCLQKVYTVTITRSPDPNYLPSDDNRILSLTLSEGLLFPSFSPDVSTYSVYLVRGQQVTLTPTPAENAVVAPLTIPAGTDEMDYTIVCNAENGESRTYTFRVILLDTPEELERIEQEAEMQSSAPSDTKQSLQWLFYIAIGITLFFLGFVFGILLFGRRKKSPTLSDHSDTDEFTVVRGNDSVPPESSDSAE